MDVDDRQCERERSKLAFGRRSRSASSDQRHIRRGAANVDGDGVVETGGTRNKAGADDASKTVTAMSQMPEANEFCCMEVLAREK